MNILRSSDLPSEAVTSSALFKNFPPANFLRVNAISSKWQIYFWSETLQKARDEFSLNRSEPTSLRVGAMCDCGRQHIATTGRVHHFPTGLCQFLAQGGHLRARGSFIMTIWMLQPGILANQFMPSVRLVDFAAVTEMAVFTLDRSDRFIDSLTLKCLLCEFIWFPLIVYAWTVDKHVLTYVFIKYSVVSYRSAVATSSETWDGSNNAHITCNQANKGCDWVFEYHSTVQKHGQADQKCLNVTISANFANQKQISFIEVEQNCELVTVKQRLGFIKHMLVYSMGLSH